MENLHEQNKTKPKPSLLSRNIKKKKKKKNAFTYKVWEKAVETKSNYREANSFYAYSRSVSLTF